MLFIQNFLDRQKLDDSSGAFEECAALVFGVFGLAEADEEAALAAAFAFTLHDGA